MSSDGKTAYERLRGKKSKVLGLEFGEKVLWRRAISSTQRANKLDTVWMEGVCLGHKTISGETIVGAREGVFKTRTVKRVPLEDRWHLHLIQEVAGVPWKCNPQADEAEQIIQDAVPRVATHAGMIGSAAAHAAARHPTMKRI